VNKKLLCIVLLVASTMLSMSVFAYPVETGKQTLYINKVQIIEQILSSMVHIKGSTYMMGTDNKKYFDITGDNAHPHKVTLSSFYFPKYLVDGTQYLSYLRLIGKAKHAKEVNLNQSVFNKRPAQDTWKYADGFCQWLGKNTGLPFSLPTEAQWEYVARDGGKNIAYPTANGKLDLGKNYPDDKTSLVKWYGQIASIPLPVDAIPVNQLGIHQMGGNVSEWMKDWYAHNYYWHSPVNNPQGPKAYPGTLKYNIAHYGAPQKVIRGMTNSSMGVDDGWQQEASNYARDSAPINAKLIGFRCVINSDKPMSQLKKIAEKHLNSQ